MCAPIYGRNDLLGVIYIDITTSGQQVVLNNRPAQAFDGASVADYWSLSVVKSHSPSRIISINWLWSKLNASVPWGKPLPSSVVTSKISCKGFAAAVIWSRWGYVAGRRLAQRLGDHRKESEPDL